MNRWGEDDLPPVERQAAPTRRLRGGHLVLVGLALVVVSWVPTALGIPTLGPMLAVLGIMLAAFGGVGWLLELLGWDPDADEGRLLDIVRLPTRIRRH